MEARVEKVTATAYEVPTDRPESDGTLEWDSTTIVVVEVSADGRHGLGYTYGHRAMAEVVSATLAPLVSGMDALAPPAAWAAMQREVRNLGRQGLCAMAISAVDIALWDLRAQLLNLSLADSLGRFREAIPARGRARGRRQRRFRRACGRPPGRALRGVRRHLLRGAGLLRRPRRPALAARRGPGGDRGGGGRVRLGPPRTRAPRRLHRRPAGRRHPLRRHHQPASRRRHLPVKVERTPLLETALQGWIFFVEGAVLRWLERRDLERGELRSLLQRALIASLTSSAR